jgi:hypothetical protein
VAYACATLEAMEIHTKAVDPRNLINAHRALVEQEQNASKA